MDLEKRVEELEKKVQSLEKAIAKQSGSDDASYLTIGSFKKTLADFAANNRLESRR